MEKKHTSYKLIHQLIGQDIYSPAGELLISKGATLHASDITKLLNHQIYEVMVMEVEELVPTFSVQLDSLWTMEYNSEMKNIYLKSLTEIKKMFVEVVDRDISPLPEFMKSFAPLLEKVLASSYLFHPLHSIKGHDEYTYRHSLNVGLIAAVIGKILGLPKQQNVLLGQMGLLHDIGKMKISNDILKKPGKLTQEEFEKVKNHTVFGYQLLQKMEDTNEMICLAALHHHERLDGSGYPYQLNENKIPFLVQIISVADTYDAICSDRIYQKKSSPYYAVQEFMQGLFLQKYNPNIVIPFIRFLAESFVGQKVKLNTNQVGTVIRIDYDEPHRPLIKVDNQFIDLRTKRELIILDLEVT